jgi:hypothetical protein
MERRAGLERKVTVPSGSRMPGTGYRYRGIPDWTPGDPRYRGLGESGPEPDPVKPPEAQPEPCPRCGGTGEISPAGGETP